MVGFNIHDELDALEKASYHKDFSEVYRIRSKIWHYIQSLEKPSIKQRIINWFESL